MKTDGPYEWLYNNLYVAPTTTAAGTDLDHRIVSYTNAEKQLIKYYWSNNTLEDTTNVITTTPINVLVDPDPCPDDILFQIERMNKKERSYLLNKIINNFFPDLLTTL